MIALPVALILIAFSFGASIFNALLGIERSVWSLAFAKDSGQRVIDADVRFVHQSLQRLTSYLPPANGFVIVVGLTGLFWQVIATGWNWPSIAVLAFWGLGQAYILTSGRIIQAVMEIRRTPSDGPIVEVRRTLRPLVQQHFNGLLHASGVVVLELALFVVR